MNIQFFSTAARLTRVAQSPSWAGSFAAALALGSAALLAGTTSRGAPKEDPAALPHYQVEWVYRVKWGHDEEFWTIFRETQIPVLDKEKELGYVLGYQVYKPGLHTSEELRWNYRIVITYKDIVASTHGGAVEKQLFPDQVAYAKQENQRWELVSSHYDLPIKEIDVHATP